MLHVDRTGTSISTSCSHKPFWLKKTYFWQKLIFFPLWRKKNRSCIQTGKKQNYLDEFDFKEKILFCYFITVLGSGFYYLDWFLYFILSCRFLFIYYFPDKFSFSSFLLKDNLSICACMHCWQIIGWRRNDWSLEAISWSFSKCQHQFII